MAPLSPSDTMAGLLDIRKLLQDKLNTVNRLKDHISPEGYEFQRAYYEKHLEVLDSAFDAVATREPDKARFIPKFLGLAS